MLEHIHESNLIENIDDEEEDDQSLLAWEYISQQEELSHGVICKVQKIITINQRGLLPTQRGYYRSLSGINVTIGGIVAPSPFMVDGLMTNWLLDYKDLSPMEAHKRFEYIHPFADGNGRTGRMLLWWQEIKNGGEPTLIKSKNKEEYYSIFK